MEKRTAVEVANALGVVASLLFVGVQIRQSAEATRAATVLQVKDGWLQFNLVQLENPEVVRALVRADDQGYQNIDQDSQWLVGSFLRAPAHIWSNSYYQYRIGTLDEEQWRPTARDIESESRRGTIWHVWDNWNHIYDDAFRAYMDSVRIAHPPTVP